MGMEKKLSIVGNSLALIIDKPLRRLLALGPERLVRVTFDGRRLIVEPIDSARPPAHSSHNEQRREALTVFRELLNTYGFGNLQWARLAPGLRVTRYISQLEAAFADPGVAPDETLMATIRRFKQCHAFLRAGHTSDQAIDAALARCPVPVDAGQPASTVPPAHEVGVPRLVITPL